MAPLEGLRVLAVENYLSGPFGSMWLADFGAEVIKIEMPAGDANRGKAPFFENELGRTSWPFARGNRNKRSVVLSLDHPEDRDAFLALVRDADVVWENLRAGSLERLGLGWDVLHACNPALVYASISGFGHADLLPSPFRDLPAFDMTTQALSGLMVRPGEEGMPPLYLGVPISDTLSGIVAGYGVLLALHSRLSTGVGQHVDISMYDVMACLNEQSISYFGHFGKEAPRGASPTSAPYGVYRCRDGWFALAVASNEIFSRFCAIIERPGLVDDERMIDGRERSLHRETFLRPLIETWAADKTPAEIAALLNTGGVPAAAVHTSRDILDCPHVAARQMMLEIDDPILGELGVVGTPIKLSAWPEVPTRPSPLLGADQDAVVGRPRPPRPATRTRPVAPPAQRPGLVAPLAGIRVLAVENYLAGPFGSMWLADHGAEVIKVEPPAGDVYRQQGPVVDTADGSMSYAFARLNRNKHSVVLSLRDPADQEAFLALADEADVVWENLRPGAFERLGLDWATLHARNPRLIYASVSGFGHDDVLASPYRRLPAFDIVAQAMSGLMLRCGEEGLPPLYLGAPHADHLSGIIAGYGVLLALHHRERTGEGQRVDISMYDVMTAFNEQALSYFALTGTEAPRGSSPTSAPSGVFQCKEGWFAVAVSSNDIWERFCDAIGARDLLADPELADGTGRSRHRETILRPRIEAWASSMTPQEAAARLNAANVPAAPVQTVRDLFACPHLAAREMIMTLTDPVFGELRVPGNPIKLGLWPRVPAGGIPQLGADQATYLPAARGLRTP
jgi:formyl-CoA transferase